MDMILVELKHLNGRFRGDDMTLMVVFLASGLVEKGFEFGNAGGVILLHLFVAPDFRSQFSLILNESFVLKGHLSSYKNICVSLYIYEKRCLC